MYANGKRNVITKETLKWQLSVSVGNKGLFNGANIYICECERTEIQREKNEKWKEMRQRSVTIEVLEEGKWCTRM